MSEEDKRLAEWEAKLRTKPDSWVHEQANRQLQPNLRKRLAAERESKRREDESNIAKAEERIAQLEGQLKRAKDDAESRVKDAKIEAGWTKVQVFIGTSGWVIAGVLIYVHFFK